MQFTQYLSELSKVRLLEAREEALLWQRYKDEGQLECRQTLIESYQPLVFKLAASWKASQAVLLDIIQEGTVGLIEAVESYDHTRGVAFSLYATHRIRGRMLNYLEREGNRSITGALAALTVEEEAELHLLDAGPSVSQQAEHNFLVEQVKCALERLPAKEQMVLNGVYLQDREPRQLAESMELSVSHIYRLQKQGIRRVRGMMARFMKNWK